MKEDNATDGSISFLAFSGSFQYNMAISYVRNARMTEHTELLFKIPIILKY